MGELINITGQVSDSQIPQAMARDTETAAAIAAHEGKLDPHPVYLTQIETAAAIAAHEGKLDPHPVYLTQDEADLRYRQSSTSTPIYTGSALPAANVAGNSIGLGWNSVQPGLGIAELCNYSGTGGGDAFNFYRVGGNATSPPTLSQRVARIDISGGFIQTSDKRLKSNFSAAPGLEALMRLAPLKYTHWGCLGFDEESQTLKMGKFFANKLGFLAQDVQKVIPEAVSIPSSKEEVWGIDYNCLLTCAIRSIQELKEEVNELRLQLKTKA